MRLHHLEACAFGPFADTVTVDFDALSDAGLFLLTGATGAGKTSVLDAVCFALYGEVPGDRQSAKRLRADQAAAGVAPQVTLEVTLSGRRFRLVRSPAWERPKKRGTGTTTQQASVRLCERRDGSWQSLSTRLDETGHLVTHLVGMNLTQFCQVAMLPQGRFQAFLRARSEERHQLLQQLFRTTRFEDIERWLRDRRRTLRQESARQHEVVADLVSRVSEAAGVPPPASWDLHDLGLPATEGAIGRWLHEHLAVAGEAADEAASLVRATTEAEARAQASLQQGTRLAELQASHAGALAERDRLCQGAHARRVGRVDAARRAAAVLPLQEVAAARAREAEDALLLSSGLAEKCSVFLDVPAQSLDEATLTRAHHAALEHATRARTMVPREAALAVHRAAIAEESTRIERLVADIADLDERLAALPARIARWRATHAEAGRAAHALPAAQTVLDTLRQRRVAADLVVTLTPQLAEARARHSESVDLAQSLKEEWLHLQEERINGMAAEIACALAVGDCCPVCGSEEHPRLATAVTGAPDAAAEKSARRRVDDAEAARHAHDVRVRDLTTRIEVARGAADGDPSTLAEAVAGAEAEVARLSGLADQLAEAAEELARVEAEQTDLTSRRESQRIALAAATSALAARQQEAETISLALAEALDGSGCASLEELADLQAERAVSFTAAATSQREAEQARRAETEAGHRAEAAAVAAGFADLTAAVEAALDAAEIATLEQQIQAHDATMARTEALLADPALRAAASVEPPDVAALETAHHACADHLAEARTAAAVSAARAQRLAGLGDALDEALGRWAPLREHLELASRMASLAEGTSSDNRLQMRLSGYVLSYRLSQVVAAANQRLARMSDQRYSLEHTGRKGARETRGGLSLLVRDDWSGEARDPATLSGGETFVVSLALALGLADVICHEVGGADLDTLFVDEGFGSLDADTLDDVMDTLDSLRDGGRVVGVVSHVAEMRDRIPAQLRVNKSRQGSTITLAR